MAEKATKRLLGESFTTTEARQWMDRRNDKEFLIREVDVNRPVYVFCNRAAKVTAAQMEVLDTMTKFGWQAYSMVHNTATNDYALACMKDDSTCIVYPDGTYDRGTNKFVFKRSTWSTDPQAIEADDDTTKLPVIASVPVKRIPLAVDNFKSSAKGMQWNHLD